MKKIAFFDFDGTITTKDTLLKVIKYHKGALRFYYGFFTRIPSFVAFKLGIMTNQQAKENMLAFFFKGTPLQVFQKKCDDFVENALPAIIRKGALAELNRLREAGFEIVVVSASAENWIRKWTDGQGIGLIATKLECIDGRLTGKIKGANCNSGEKVSRILSVFDLSGYDEIYVYGDTKGDHAMLKLATKSHYKPFR